MKNLENKRTCIKCKKEKPLEDFYKNRSSLFGRLHTCKLCSSFYNKNNRYHKWNFHSFGGNRDAALSRDGFRCVLCGMTREQHRKTFKRDITIDHIDGRGRNSASKNNDMDNLQTLCLSCHGRKDINIYLKHRKDSGV